MTIGEARLTARNELPVEYFGKRYMRIVSITEHYNSRDKINTHACILQRDRCRKGGVFTNDPNTAEVWYEASAIDKNGNVDVGIKIQGLKLADEAGFFDTFKGYAVKTGGVLDEFDGTI